MGSQTVGHDWMTFTFFFFFSKTCILQAQGIHEVKKLNTGQRTHTHTHKHTQKIQTCWLCFYFIFIAHFKYTISFVEVQLTNKIVTCLKCTDTDLIRLCPERIPVCCSVLSPSVMSDSATPRTVALQAPLSMGILQARIVEWVAMPSSRGSSQPRDRTQVSLIAGGFFTTWATREAPEYWSG